MPNLDQLISLQRPLPGVRANFVVDASGSFTDSTGGSRALSNENDRQVLIALRKLSDLVITDASTARANHYKPSKWVPILVWSKSGDFSGIDEQLSQLAGEKGFADLDLRIATDQKILLETSPSLTRLLAGHIDELKLTVTGCHTEDQADSVAKSIRSSLQLEDLSHAEVYPLEGSFFFTFNR